MHIQGFFLAKLMDMFIYVMHKCHKVCIIYYIGNYSCETLYACTYATGYFLMLALLSLIAVYSYTESIAIIIYNEDCNIAITRINAL